MWAAIAFVFVLGILVGTFIGFKRNKEEITAKDDIEIVKPNDTITENDLTPQEKEKLRVRVREFNNILLGPKEEGKIEIYFPCDNISSHKIASVLVEKLKIAGWDVVPILEEIKKEQVHNFCITKRSGLKTEENIMRQAEEEVEAIVSERLRVI